MKNIVTLVLSLAVLGTGISLAADALSEQQKAKNKLLAYRAARADAIRKLAERIKGLKITSDTTVKDFVAESDTIQTRVNAFLTGCREKGEPKYMSDGICTVTVEVPLVDVVVCLEQTYKECYKGNKLKIEDFQKITVNNEVKILEETGSGAPRPEIAGEAIPAGKDAESIDIPANARAYWLAHVTGQGRLMAVRAARVEGMRRLAERIKGVRIDSSTTVQDFVAQSDDIRVSMNTFLKGVRETAVRYHPDELIVDVDVEVTLETVYASLQQWSDAHYKGDKVKLQAFEKLTVEAKRQVIQETGRGVPPEKYLKDVKPAEVAAATAAATSPDWASQTMQVVGRAALDTNNANKAQAKLMAERGAEIEGRRKLAEQLNGLKISSSTTVSDFVAQNDNIRTEMIAFQVGAGVVPNSVKWKDDGTVEVTVEIDLSPLWDTIVFCQKKYSVTIK